MIDETKKQFICGLPYQLSIAEGLLDEDTVVDEMMETDFNQIKFQIKHGLLHWKQCVKNSFNCWNPLRALSPKRKDERYLNVTV